MKEDWEKAITFVLKEEGGYGVHPNDRGGETNFGISKRRFPNEDIAAMTEARAKHLYRLHYWDLMKCDELPSPMAIAVFDAAVNQGEGWAARALQLALGVPADGNIGPRTIAAANKAGIHGVRRFLQLRMVRYARIIMRDPTQDVFIETWSKRLMCLAEICFSQQATV